MVKIADNIDNDITWYHLIWYHYDQYKLFLLHALINALMIYIEKASM